MLATADLAHAAAETIEELAPAAEESAAEAEAASEIASQGSIPEVAEATVASAEPSASDMAYEERPVADVANLDHGMHRVEDYYAQCEAAGAMHKWNPNYAHGHTTASQWTQPYEGRYDNTFALKPGCSASQALRDFMAGPTIADFRVIGVAIEMEELRDELGDQEFDRMFGSADGGRDAQIPAAQRLKLTSDMYTIPFVDQMLAMAAESAAADQRAEEPNAPVVEARVEEKPSESAMEQPSPEMIAEELGMPREQEIA